MRIVHTCLRYPPATGGVETYVKEIVDRTRNIDEKRDVRVLTSTMKTHGPITELDPSLLLDDPIYVQRLHHSSTPLISYPRLQALSYYLGHHQPDIIHGYSFWYQPADVAARYAHKHNIPFIFHPIYYENSIREKTLWSIYKSSIGKKTFKLADVVAVISPFEQELIEKAGFPVKRFELIPPGVSDDLYTPVPTNPFANKGMTGTILLTVSRIAESKGLEDIVQALPTIRDTIPDINLVMVGEDFGARQSLENQAKQLGIEKHVHFLGKLSRPELVGAYQHADIFIHPSHYEAFGIVVAEAMAAGTPVVARNTSAIPFVAPHNTAGLLFDTKDELVSSILLLQKDSEKRRMLVEKAKHRARTSFSWESSISKITSLYEELTS